MRGLPVIEEGSPIMLVSKPASTRSHSPDLLSASSESSLNFEGPGLGDEDAPTEQLLKKETIPYRLPILGVEYQRSVGWTDKPEFDFWSHTLHHKYRGFYLERLRELRHLLKALDSLGSLGNLRANERVRSVLKNAELGDIHMVAHSMGAGLGLSLTHEEDLKKRLKSLVLHDPFCYFSSPEIREMGIAGDFPVMVIQSQEFGTIIQGKLLEVVKDTICKNSRQHCPEREIDAYLVKDMVHQEISDIKYCMPLSSWAFDVLFRSFSLSNVMECKDHWFSSTAVRLSYRKLKKKLSYGVGRDKHEADKERRELDDDLSSRLRECVQDLTVQFLDRSAEGTLLDSERQLPVQELECVRRFSSCLVDLQR